MLYETERLQVRRWRAEDAADLYEYCSDPETTRFLVFPTYTSMKDAHVRLADVARHYAVGGIEKTDYAITLRDSGKVIGSIGWVGYDAGNSGMVEIGYVLNSRFRHKGYMTEALVGMFGYIKREKLAMRITAKHDTENVASGAVMQRAGMTYEGTMRKAGENNKGGRVDLALYSILYEEI